MVQKHVFTLREKYTKLHVHFKAKSEICVLTLNIERHNVNTKRNQIEFKPTGVIVGETACLERPNQLVLNGVWNLWLLESSLNLPLLSGTISLPVHLRSTAWVHQFPPIPYMNIHKKSKDTRKQKEIQY